MGETLDTIGSGLALVAAVGGLLTGVAVGVDEVIGHRIGIEVGFLQTVQFLEERLPYHTSRHMSACEMGWTLEDNGKTFAQTCGPKAVSLGRFTVNIKVQDGRTVVAGPA